MLIKNKEFLSASTALEPLSYKKYKNIPNGILEQAQEYGTALHEAFEMFYKNIPESDILENLNIPNQKKAFETFKKIMSKEKILKSSIETEKHIINEAKLIHGYIDLIALTKKEKTIIFYDYKIRSKIESEDNFLIEKLQNTFYELVASNGTAKQDINWKIIIIEKNKPTNYLIIEKNKLDKNEIELLNSIVIDLIKIWKKQQKYKKEYICQIKKIAF